jgi:hypothetical protein
MPKVVSVERRDQASARGSKRGVAGRSDTLVRLTDELYPRIRIGYLLDDLRSLIL